MLLAASYALTGGRLLATTAALLAVAGVALGASALARPGGRRRAAAALTAGTIGALAGAVVIAVADGGPGSGSGVVGGWAALAFGLIAAGLGGLALARLRRSRDEALR
ncbi:DUF6223 family protein [Paractinoplanes maris]|uniref:DUF6223 family protein n=1 Tax=Paractinoplanes maris TaxID=1734446 RepID=UPI00201FF1FE|nr:DUF6223 family protein [Actinoplanes maris]